MQPGIFAAGDVRATTTRVLVDGVQRPHISWSVDRELSGDLPQQVVAGSGITQATGKVAWASAETVSDIRSNPWNPATGWLPTKGASVVIYAGDGISEWVQFTGVIDRTTGSLRAGLESTIIDRYDDLSAAVTHEALLAVMPPSVPGGAFRGTGLVHTYYVDLAMRAGGFYCTPAQEPHCALSVPCQGGMWPHLGTSVLAGTQNAASYPSNSFAPWGFAVSNFSNTYLANSPQTASTPVQLTFMVAPNHNGFYYMRAAYGSTYVQLSINSNWIATAIIGGTTVASFTLSGKGGFEGRVVQMLVKGGAVQLKASTGQSSTGSASFSGSTTMGTVTVSGDAGTRVAGIQISHPSTAAQEFASIGFVASAVINTSNTTFMGISPAIPAIEAEPAVDILKAISEASLAGLWIDELGVMQWWPALALQAQQSRETLTTLNDIIDLEWEDSLLGARSKVTVKYQAPSVKISRWQNVELYVGNGATLESEEVAEEVIGPDDDKAWYGVDETPRRLGTSNWGLYNNRRGSFIGGFFSSSGDTISEAGLTLSISFTKSGVARYKVKHTAGVYPADVTANLATSPTAADLWERNRDKPLPRVGGHGFAQWNEGQFTPTGAGGVGPELVHETGIWIPADIIERIATYLQGQTSVPKPVVTGLEVLFNPRRQLGDLATVTSRKLLGVTMSALVVGVSTSANGNKVSQSLAVRISEVTRSSKTYKEVNDSLPGSPLTYTQVQALGPVPQTYEQSNDAV